MQPILMLAIVGVAATALGVGVLNNVITLNVQQLGVGEQPLVSPITVANIDLQVTPTKVRPTDTFFKNLVNFCSFHSDDRLIDPTQNDLFVICKLTDDKHQVIAEGSDTINYVPSETAKIEITNPAFPGANQVQNVHDVTIVVLGHNPHPP